MKRKDELRDIYQSNNKDIEEDFTPQVAQEIIEQRQHDLTRSRILALSLGGLTVFLSVALVAVAIRNLLIERTVTQPISTQDLAYIPRHSLPFNAAWVMDYQQAALQTELDNELGEKPLSIKWVKDAAFHIIMGQQALALEESDQALIHFQKVVEIYPEIEGLHRAMGMLYIQKEDFSLATEHLEKALLEEELFDVVNNLGTAYIGIEKYDLADTHLLKALELQPENPACHKNIAILYRKMDRENDAVFHFEKYLDLRPSDLETMQTYALYLTKLGRWEDAAKFLTDLTEEVTNVAPIYFLLAQVQLQNGQEEKALAALQRGIQLVDPTLALAWMSRDEFNSARGSQEFQTLVDQLEIASVSLEDL